jgi:carboxylate-amine ligase
MVEGKTGVCADLGQLRAQVADMRAGLIGAGQATGVALAAAGSFPGGDWRALGFTPKPRYERVAAAYARLADEHVICACHVHVGVAGRDLAIRVINRVRPWLPVLLALSASSPISIGEDTGYASWRAMVWARWPAAGMPPEFSSYVHYRETVDMLIAAGASFDAGQAFWDIRPGTNYETVEFRIADACTTIDETVVQAGLSRALVQTCLDEIARGDPGVGFAAELLPAAKWRAARFGLDGTLVDPFSGAQVSARSLLERLLDYVRPALDAAGDSEEVMRLVWSPDGPRPSSADRQRRVLAETGRIADVVDLLLEETAGS